MKKMIAILLNLLVSLFSSLFASRSESGSVTIEQIAGNKEPIRFNGMLVERPEWMGYDSYRDLLKQQNKRLRLYLRSKRHNGYMGYTLSVYNLPYQL